MISQTTRGNLSQARGGSWLYVDISALLSAHLNKGCAENSYTVFLYRWDGGSCSSSSSSSFSSSSSSSSSSASGYFFFDWWTSKSRCFQKQEEPWWGNFWFVTITNMNIIWLIDSRVHRSCLSTSRCNLSASEEFWVEASQNLIRK